MSTTTPPTTEQYTVSGSKLISTIKHILHEGSVRRIRITDKSGKVLLDMPLTAGVVGLVMAPVLAVVGAIAALVTECTIVVDRA